MRPVAITDLTIPPRKRGGRTKSIHTPASSPKAKKGDPGNQQLYKNYVGSKN